MKKKGQIAMKMTKILAIIGIVVLLGITAIEAFAADNAKNDISKGCPLMTEEQKAEMQSKMEERLAQALADGKITQEQYDSILDGSCEGRMMHRFGSFCGGMMHKFGGRGFKSEKPDLTDEQKAEMQSKMEERLAQALADGKITQEQYDSILDGTCEGKMCKFGDFCGGMMHKFGGRGFKGEKPDLNN
jgi:uncharacterized membrane protein